MDNMTAFRSVREEPFVIDGLYHPERPGVFRRLPEELAEKYRVMPDPINQRVAGHATAPAGGRVRFSTDASQLTIKVTIPGRVGTSTDTQTLLSMSGFDLSAVDVDGEARYHCSLSYNGNTDLVEGGLTVNLPGDYCYDYILYLPYLMKISDIEIAVNEGATLAAPKVGYKIEKPILFYGSSITHGASCSRPGLVYSAIIGRNLNANFINLGFAGAARAEDEMIEYVAEKGSELSAFVLDYDHNTPSVEYLKQTHPKFYHAVREKNPDLPIFIVSAPAVTIQSDGWKARRAVILRTYVEGIEAGDRNLHLIDGFTMMQGDVPTDELLIDGTHPCDLGFHRMALAIGGMIDRAFRDR